MGSGESRRTSLRTRLGIIAVVFLAMVVTTIGVSTLMVRSWDRALDERGDARIVADDVAELRLAFSDQQTGVRGYQLSADPTFLEPYRDGSAVQREITDRLYATDLSIPGFDDAIDRVITAGERWRTDVAEPTISDLADAPGDDLAQARFEQVRNELDQLEQTVADKLDELERRADRMQRNVFAVLFGSAVAAILGSALAAALFRRWVTRPLAEISSAARALSHDDTTPLPHFDAPELDDVSEAVDSLQRSLTSARDDAVTALHGLEQSAVLAIQVRSELADELGDMPDGWAAHTLLVPAEGVVAGDCFDIGLLDAGRMYIVLIDVTGHGAAAALDALKAKAQLRAALRSRLAPGAALSWLSREMLKDEHAQLLTASVIIIHLQSGRLDYASAGHPPALLTDGNEVRTLDHGGPLVGAFAATWETTDTDLPLGWTLLVHTDGITDTIGADRERFGEERLQACLTTPDPNALLARLQDEVESFRVGPRSDDATAIAVSRVGTAPRGADASEASADGRRDTLPA